ncbi:hypothetical protein EWB00_001239 [Schistosoma japonicum]|uniref:SJCHGC08351 protein n=1 Tax=Schistosoma japonicum TaxID=6182 RepID=Q5D8H9_SCHJA|nr:SJCHGC08351 protein [Schistosoma japonicum]KAH8872354.1 hypothetical protein KSF78_0006528 [Schistosoma japonicum]KAH8872355.1 hypothetical protein KSF78_0006528 [Schistosoma japonicum]KAH8872356.1 hypothetical protein KSF78_0006528 [Schistosoma japonicum]TNN15499.1 hypothetical protein EWB00_001239 [Schistosoma japonicum]
MSDEIDDKEQGNIHSSASVLSDISILNIAKALTENDMRIFLLLNIPLTTCVNNYEEMRTFNQREAAFNQKTLMYWKKLRETVKDDVKIAELEYALRQSDHKELADILIERNRLNLEITRDLLQK